MVGPWLQKGGGNFFEILEIFGDRGTPFLGGGELVMVAEGSGSGGG